MLFAPKESGQGLIEWLIVIALFIWIVWSILRLPGCNWNLWRAVLVWRSCP